MEEGRNEEKKEGGKEGKEERIGVIEGGLR